MQGKQAGKKCEKGGSCALLFPFPHFLPAFFLFVVVVGGGVVVVLVQMQVQPNPLSLN